MTSEDLINDAESKLRKYTESTYVWSEEECFFCTDEACPLCSMPQEYPPVLDSQDNMSTLQTDLKQSSLLSADDSHSFTSQYDNTGSASQNGMHLGQTNNFQTPVPPEDHFIEHQYGCPVAQAPIETIDTYDDQLNKITKDDLSTSQSTPSCSQPNSGAAGTFYSQLNPYTTGFSPASNISSEKHSMSDFSPVFNKQNSLESTHHSNLSTIQSEKIVQEFEYQSISYQISESTHVFDKNKQPSTSSENCVIINIAELLHNKAKGIFMTFSNKHDVCFYKFQFETTISTSNRFFNDYKKINNKNKTPLEWLIEEKAYYIEFHDKVLLNLDFDIFILQGYKYLKEKYSNIDEIYERNKLYLYIIHEYIELQEYYSLFSILLILEVFRHHNKDLYTLLISLKFLNYSIMDLKMRDLSLEKNKTFIITLVGKIYNYFMRGEVNIIKEGKRTFKNDKCEGPHTDLLFVFIMNLCSTKKYNNLIRKKTNNNFIQYYEAYTIDNTSSFFFVTCCSLLHRHLLLNVIIQNINYDTQKIVQFIKDYSSNNSCIGCMTKACYEILEFPIMQDMDNTLMDQEVQNLA